MEHEVSIQSARNVFAAVDPAKYDVVLIGIDHAGRWRLCDPALLLAAASPTAKLPPGATADALAFVPGSHDASLAHAGHRSTLPPLDVIFPLVHGTGGEDGTLQGLLELAQLPYVGPGVLGSAVGMDKDTAKRLLRDAGIPVADSVTLRRAAAATTDFATLAGRLGAPFFVKPANSGSSVGITKVHSAAEWPAARDLALRYDDKLLVETFIRGREIEVAVLGNDTPEASVPGEIVPSHEFYSYEAKYLDENGAALRIPAELPAEVAARVRQLACQAFLALDCAGMARVDFFVTADGCALVNEINTIPGFTKISMYPKLWAATGLPYPALIERLIQLALERHAARQRRETALKS